MAENLVIRLGMQPGDPVSWMVVDEAGNRLGAVQTGPLRAAAMRGGQRRIQVLVPGTEVVLTSVELPVRGTAKLQQAVPFALEEQFAEDIEELHFAIGKRDSKGRVPVAVVARERLQAWLDELREAGLEPQVLLPDTLGLPTSPGAASVLLDGDHVFVATAGEPPVVLQIDDLQEVLAAVGIIPDLDSEEEIERALHLTVYLEEKDYERNKLLLEQLRGQLSSLQAHIMADGPLPHLVVAAFAYQDRNLLQGPYASKSGTQKLWRPWRAAAAVLGALVVVSLGAQALELRRLTVLEKQLDASIEETIKETFPHVRRIPQGSEEALFRQELNKLQGTGEEGQRMFLQMLGVLGTVLAENPGTVIKTLSFRNEIMSLQLRARNVEALDRIKQKLAESGLFEAEIQSATQVDEAIEGRMQLRRSEK